MEIIHTKPTCHTWSCSGVSVAVRYRVAGHNRTDEIYVDFDRLGIARGGLLESALRQLECPIGRSTIQPLLTMLDLGRHPRELLPYLGAPASELDASDIIRCFELIEDGIAKADGKSHYSLSINARSVLCACTSPLKDLQQISDLKFKSRFSPPPRGITKNLWSYFAIPENEDEDLRTPLVFKDFNSLEERNKNSAAVVRKTREFIAQKCVETLDAYDALVNKITEIKSTPRPRLRKNSLESLESGNIPCQRRGSRNKTSEEIRIWLILNAIEKNKYYTKTPEPGALRLQNISILTTLTAKPSWGPDLFATALSDYYIPRLVTVACIILIALETGWNADAIYSLTSQDIIRTRTGYQLIGLKGRGNQQQNATVVDPNLKPPKKAEVEEHSDDDSEIDNDKYASHPATVRAIDLLLKNLERIKKHTGIKSSRVFLSLNLQKNSPNMFIETIYDEALSDFCKHHHFPNLSLKDIRDIAAHHWYLCPDGSVYQVNVFLNHKDLTTTSIYLHSTILESLYDANILRYMKKLSASIIFSCGRQDILESKTTLKNHADKDLLFPVSPMQPESDKSLVDKWLDANGEINIKIGRNEIQHCASQYLYYRGGFYEMANSNPERFVKYHLPRIVTCIALRNVILSSTHAAILTSYEEKLHAPSPIASNKLHW